MAQPTIFYDLGSVTCVLAGRVIGGWGATDAITTEAFEDDATVVAGADGTIAVQYSSVNAVNVTLTVMQGTEGYKALLALAQEQKASRQNGNVIEGMTFKVFDPNSRISLSDNNASFTKIPTPVFGKEVAEVEFVLVLPNGKAPGNYSVKPT